MAKINLKILYINESYNSSEYSIVIRKIFERFNNRNFKIKHFYNKCYKYYVKLVY